MAFEFSIQANSSTCSARAGTFSTPHGVIETPIFMPVGTKATVKAMTPEEMTEIGAQILLANTFHLYIRPGDEIVKQLGGLHKMMNWDKPLLTDSGGFQVFSLGDINKITEEGVKFRSPMDGSPLFLTPKKAVEIQHNLGADIIMVFDECAPYPAEHSYVKKSAEMTARWAKLCKDAHTGHEDIQALFGIVQGGVYPDLRQWSAQATIDIEFPGYAIGGLSVGETKPEMEENLDVMDACLPKNKPRYLMGVGTPQDFFRGIERGIDMFDCVLPARSARSGRIYTREGVLNIRNAVHAIDTRPLSESCSCYCCRNYSRGYIRHLIQSSEILASRLTTWHNLHYFVNLVKEIRQAIIEDKYEEYKAFALQNYDVKA